MLVDVVAVLYDDVDKSAPESDDHWFERSLSCVFHPGLDDDGDDVSALDVDGDATVADAGAACVPVDASEGGGAALTEGMFLRGNPR